MCKAMTRKLLDVGVRRLREAAELWPRVARRPAVLAAWVARSWKAHVLLAVSVVGVGFTLPPMLDAAAPRIFPDVETAKKLLWLIPRTVHETDPRADRFRRSAMRIAWSATGVAFLLALGLHLPGAVAHCDAVARERERKAQQCKC